VEDLMNPRTVSSDLDFVLPGEDWFLYWRTSAALWPEKLRQIKGKRVIIPLYWAMHVREDGKVDFSEERPSTDLAKLINLIGELGKEAVLFVPLSPLPFLPNGGIPPLLVKGPSISPEGLIECAMDLEGHVHKLYSFFDVRIYQAFVQFAQALGQYLSQQHLAVDVWGIEGGYLADGKFMSYLEDRSKVFEQAFSRFLAVKKDEYAASDVPLTVSPEKERALQDEFTATIRDLYTQTAQERTAHHWEGSLRVAFLGGGHQSFFQRLAGGDTQESYAWMVQDALAQNALPSTILLSPEVKQGPLARLMQEMVAQGLLIEKFQHRQYEQDNTSDFLPIVFFNILATEEGTWQRNGLLTYLQQHYRGLYRFVDPAQGPSEDPETLDRPFFITGAWAKPEKLSLILKSFMAGGRLILDQQQLPPETLRRLETFIIENNLHQESINLQTVVRLISLGDGRLILFDGRALEGLEVDGQMQFWTALLQVFNLQHLAVKCDDPVICGWRTRTSNALELNYEEIRRMGLYNPTSYKRKIKMDLPKNFVLARVIDEQHVKVQTLPGAVAIEMLPGGSVAIDFGLFAG
jgi:hypothetical protein